MWKGRIVILARCKFQDPSSDISINLGYSNEKDLPLLPLHPVSKEQGSKLQCLKVLTPSGWNPPPGHRKLHGDLLYLQVQVDRLIDDEKGLNN